MLRDGGRLAPERLDWLCSYRDYTLARQVPVKLIAMAGSCHGHGPIREGPPQASRPHLQESGEVQRELPIAVMQL